MLSDSESDTNATPAGVNIKTSRTGKKDKDDYRLRNVLKPGRTTQYTAKALYDQIEQNDIVLDPEYQRDVVWSDSKQIGLVDSIFRNFYVPPILFSVTTEDDGTERRICIDGKQRLTSIQNFFKGLIPHRDPLTNEKLWFVDDGSDRMLLPSHYKNLFQNKQIVCIEYTDLPDDLEREVFQRVQMGMALTTAGKSSTTPLTLVSSILSEKLQAFKGPWPDFIRGIINKYHLGPNGIASNMDVEQTRARDFQNIAQILFCIVHLPQYTHGTPLQIEKWLQQQDAPSNNIRKKIRHTFKIYKDIANDTQLNAPFNNPTRVAPVEFVMTAVLIAIHKETLSMSQLSHAIGVLRKKTRAEHIDVRANARVFKTMFSIITNDIQTESVLGQEAIVQPVAYSTLGSSKRKRNANSRENSSDENPGSISTGKKQRTAKKRAIVSRASDAEQSGNISRKGSPANPQVKFEEASATTLPTVSETTGVPSDPKAASSGSTWLERLRAAKHQLTEILDFGWSTPQVPDGSPKSLFASSSVPNGIQPIQTKLSLETAMMS